MIILSAFLGAAMMRSELQQKVVMQRMGVQEAFYAAEAGVERAIFELRRNPNWSPGVDGQPPVNDARLNSVTDDDNTTIGYYSLTVADGDVLGGWNTTWIRSVGRSVDASFPMRDAVRVIFARVIIENPARFLVSTLGRLDIQSGADLESDILAENVNFLVNYSYPEGQRGIMIDGDVFYIDGITDDDDPFVTITGDVQESDSITFPGVDVDRYREIATNLLESDESIMSDGDLDVDLSNLQDLVADPPDNFEPLIIFAEGDIHISGDYGHSLLVVSGGDTYLEGDIRVDPLGSFVTTPQIGIFSNEELIIPETVVTSAGNLTVEGFVMADGDNSDGRLYGQGANDSLETLTFNGAMALKNNSADTAVDLKLFKTRNYQYNADLVDNRSIPFSPFIVNLLRWLEVAEGEDFPPEQD